MTTNLSPDVELLIDTLIGQLRTIYAKEGFLQLAKPDSDLIINRLHKSILLLDEITKLAKPENEVVH